MADKVFLTEHTKTGVYRLRAGVDFRAQIFKIIKRIGFVKESGPPPQEDVTLTNASPSDNCLKYTDKKTCHNYREKWPNQQLHVRLSAHSLSR